MHFCVRSTPTRCNCRTRTSYKTHHFAQLQRYAGLLHVHHRHRCHRPRRTAPQLHHHPQLSQSAGNIAGRELPIQPLQMVECVPERKRLPLGKTTPNFGDGKTIGLSANVLSLYAQQTITLPGAWKLEVSGYYTSPSIWGWYVSEPAVLGQHYWRTAQSVQRARVGGAHGVGPVQQSAVAGVLASLAACIWMPVAATRGRQVRLNFTYNFGSKQIKASRQRKNGTRGRAGATVIVVCYQSTFKD